MNIVNDEMQFLGCSMKLPQENGLWICSSGCGSGKSTIIKKLAKEKQNDGVLIVVSTIKEAEEYEKYFIGEGIQNYMILNGDRKANMIEYRKNPEIIQYKKILVITHVRLQIDPYQLFTYFPCFNGKEIENKMRKYIFIDEMINFYPPGFKITQHMISSLTYISNKAKIKGIMGIPMGGFYRHQYKGRKMMEAALKNPKENKLESYKKDIIIEHVLNNGIDAKIEMDISTIAKDSIVILFDATADCLFKGKDKRLLPITGKKYCSDIELIMFRNMFKRKSTEDWTDEIILENIKPLKELIEKTPGFFLIVVWKTLDTIKRRNASVYENYFIEKQYGFPQKLTDLLIKSGVDKNKFKVIYRGSGMDRGSNEYRDYENIILYGRWLIDGTTVKGINRMFGIKASLNDYMESLLIQTICRLRIRQHQGKSIKVFYTDDIDYNLMAGVQEYFKKNTAEGHTVKGIYSPCKKLTKPEKKNILDMTLLYGYDKKIKERIENEKPYSFSISFKELSGIIPKPRIKLQSYSGLIKLMKSKGIKMKIKK